jgi:hypothetical protein
MGDIVIQMWVLVALIRLAIELTPNSPIAQYSLVFITFCIQHYPTTNNLDSLYRCAFLIH